MEELTGRLAVVHPELTIDPVSRQGQIGVIAMADLKNDTISVGFGGGPLGRYSSDALLVLKDKRELYQEIMTGVMGMDSNTFKELLDINMKQEYSDYGHTSAAMKIAIENPEVMKRSMISLEDYISQNRIIDVSEEASVER
ncbi:hypothetical protein GJU39_01435 [Pedobacter petrophilus]|uniref:Uncharacterized protein n=1 Tax=Pedobacter petrophilus TaxID=1908241 RepID=A0A7K0FSZ5_9SPHI|nr:hypothetical protein [Pedobacter petrophilus]MRX74737.1 hypothetical protein [Pedobacter petrophilus]